MSPVDEKIDRYAKNMNRMNDMKLTDHEAQQVAGFLAHVEEMGAALDAVMRRREEGGN